MEKQPNSEHTFLSSLGSLTLFGILTSGAALVGADVMNMAEHHTPTSEVGIMVGSFATLALTGGSALAWHDFQQLRENRKRR